MNNTWFKVIHGRRRTIEDVPQMEWVLVITSPLVAGFDEEKLPSKFTCSDGTGQACDKLKVVWNVDNSHPDLSLDISQDVIHITELFRIETGQGMTCQVHLEEQSQHEVESPLSPGGSVAGGREGRAGHPHSLSRSQAHRHR